MKSFITRTSLVGKGFKKIFLKIPMIFNLGIVFAFLQKFSFILEWGRILIQRFLLLRVTLMLVKSKDSRPWKMIDLESNSQTVFVKWIHGCTDYILGQKWVFIFQINTKVPFYSPISYNIRIKIFDVSIPGDQRSSINNVVKIHFINW